MTAVNPNRCLMKTPILEIYFLLKKKNDYQAVQFLALNGTIFNALYINVKN